MRWRLTAENDLKFHTFPTRLQISGNTTFKNSKQSLIFRVDVLPTFFQFPTATTPLNYALCLSPLLVQPISILFTRDYNCFHSKVHSYL